MASAVRCRHPSSCDADLIRSSASVSIFCGFAPPITIVRSCPRCSSFPFFTSSIHLSFLRLIVLHQSARPLGKIVRNQSHFPSLCNIGAVSHSKSIGWFGVYGFRLCWLVLHSAAAAIFAIVHRWLFTFLVLNALLPLTAWILPSRHLFSSI